MQLFFLFSREKLISEFLKMFNVRKENKYRYRLYSFDNTDMSSNGHSSSLSFFILFHIWYVKMVGFQNLIGMSQDVVDRPRVTLLIILMLPSIMRPLLQNIEKHWSKEEHCYEAFIKFFKVLHKVVQRKW